MNKINTTVDLNKQLIVNTVSGYHTPYEYMKRIQQNLDNNPMKYALWDYSNADLSNLTNENLTELMQFTVDHPNTHVLKKVALVLPSDLSYGLGRMFETFGEIENAPWEIRPFRSMEEAFLWLGVQDIREADS